MTVFALEETFYYSHWDSDSSGSHATILAVDDCVSALRNRWNAYCEREKQSKSIIQPEPMKSTELQVRYAGSTRGGYASAHYSVRIIPFPQFDDAARTDKGETK